MDKQERALSILKEARQLLASRLADMVVDSDEDILEDAQGFSYMDEIDTLQEKAGGRLNIVNGLIASLATATADAKAEAAAKAAEEAAAKAADQPADDSSDSTFDVTAPTTEATAPKSPIDPHATVAPHAPVYSQATPASSSNVPPMKFALFAQQAAANDIAGASQTLMPLLNVSEAAATRAATHFRDRLNEDPTTIQKAMSLRATLTAGKQNDSLMLLWDCFGLQGLQAVSAMATLKASLTAA